VQVWAMHSWVMCMSGRVSVASSRSLSVHCLYVMGCMFLHCKLHSGVRNPANSQLPI
jgi:hypothetical protein